VPRLNPILEQLTSYPIVELNRIRDGLRAEGRTIYDFGTGDPKEPTPAFIREAFLGALKEESSYPSIRGTPELREAISAYAQRRFGIDLDPDTQILPTSGSKEALFHLPLALIDRSAPDRVGLFPDPGYPAYERGILFAGGEPVPMKLRGDHHLRLEELDDGLLQRARLMIINSPHNPTGVVLSREELREIHAICRANDILLISDECYVDIYDDSRPHSMLEVATEGVVAVHSLSKRSGMTGYRSGFLAGDPYWIETLTKLRANPGLAAGDCANAAAAVAWAEDEHADRRRKIFAHKRAVVLEFMREVNIEVVDATATFYIWFKAPAGYDDESYARRLLEVGIVVTPGRMFACTDAANGYLRMALVPTPDTIREALSAWRTLL
jgi:succinyldiaminopimelate transaminase